MGIKENLRIHSKFEERMILDFDQNISQFIKACNEEDVQMLMVGGATVNFHGYQRHSADINFWIDVSKNNLSRLKKALLKIGFDDFEFPRLVENGEQNISIKISPVSDIELITKFNPGKVFEEAWNNAVDKETLGFRYKVISLEDLINSKVKSSRTKDLLDITELKRINQLL